MARWSGVCGEKGRWKQNLIAKCMRDGKAHDDASVSPVVRQTLLHWAYELTEADFKQALTMLHPLALLHPSLPTISVPTHYYDYRLVSACREANASRRTVPPTCRVSS